ncbi:MAG: c-type cytochrome [Planctomycetia bacterium]|nr:c-type cytochrome [Planctomycetia bacterium]
MPVRRAIVNAGAIVLALLALVSPAPAQKSPEDELAALEPAAGIDVSLYASEPLITNPSAIDVDTQGRVWVAEIQWYRAAVKEPPADKIKVLEDTDGDGRADRATVFADGLFGPMSICVAGPKVYVATSPDLWVYEDKDGDLKADGPPQKLLTGFGGRNHDHGAHSLVLGPDHKWWMSHGDTGFDVTGSDGGKIAYKWGACMRGELDGGKLELVAVNFRNPYEPCVSSFGEPFLSDNDNDGNFSARICWLMEGGNYGWFGRPPAKAPPGTPFGEHWHFRGHVPGYVPATLVTGFGSPCGICFYEGDAFGPHLKNAPLHTDAGPREVRVYPHENAGAGMRAASENILTSQGDDYFRPDDICAAPDGSLYVSDWYDGGVGGHAYNNPNQGRIFLLRPSGKKLTRVGKPGPFATIEDAIGGLKNPNLATQFLARERLLAEGAASVPALTALLTAEDPNYRARALWVLDRIGGDARRVVIEQLKSPSGRFRALAVRILRRHGDEYDGSILGMADDPEVEVRREVLLALRNLRGERADAALLKLASMYDGTDRYLLEAIHVAAGDRKLALAKSLAAAGLLSFDTVDLVQVLDPDRAAGFLVQGIARADLDEAGRARLLARLSTVDSLEAGKAVLAVAVDRAAPEELRRTALRSVSRNLADDWKELAERPDFASGVAQLLAEPGMRTAAIDLVDERNLRRFGTTMLVLAHSRDLAGDVRARAIQVAAHLRTEGVAAACETLVSQNGEPLCTAALEALVEMQSWAAVKKMLASADTPDAQKAAAIKRSMASVAGSLVLLRLIDEGVLSEELRTDVIAQATKHADSNIRVLYERFVPEAQRPKRLGASVRAEDILALAGDNDRGRQIFFKSSAARCKACHRVNGFGSTIGPDLSQIGKKYERATLLETILEPSKAIAPEYVAYLVETTGGQVHAGFIEKRDDKEIVLKDVEGKAIRVPADEVASVQPQTKSLMPELVLQEITAQDAADLLAYLSSLTNPVPAAAGQ